MVVCEISADPLSELLNKLHEVVDPVDMELLINLLTAPITYYWKVCSASCNRVVSLHFEFCINKRFLYEFILGVLFCFFASMVDVCNYLK